MLDRLIKPTLRADPEFQSALIRSGIWVFAAAYIGLGGASEYYRVNAIYYLWLFGSYLVIFAGLLVSIIRRPGWEARRYFSVVVDISATSFAIFLTNEAISPFYLLYIWIFVSYGTRYGKNHLTSASILSFIAYSLVLTAMGEWQENPFEAFFFLLVLIVLPMYQYSLLARLHEARLEAERSNRAKSDFLSNMTHELRTPLSGIVGMSRLLGATALDREQRDYLGSISSSAEHLGTLVHDVLDVSKIEAGELLLHKQSFDLPKLIHGVCVALAPQAQAKGLELICWIDSGLPRQALGDPLRLRQILFNLVGNAVKFTQQGDILVYAHQAEGDAALAGAHLYLEVRDTGIGIPAHALDQVFDKFWQFDGSSTRQFGGTGLGTTIARDLVYLMGGEIGVHSEPGQGSTFWVRLPVLGDAEGVQTPVRQHGLAGLKALIFERNATSLAALVEACVARGMGCRTVGALDELESAVASDNGAERPDVILMADSPSGDGAVYLNTLFSRRLEVRLPVLFLGYNGRLPTMDSPLFHALAKPFTPEMLEQALMELMQPASASLQPIRVAPKQCAAQEDRVSVLVAEDNAINAKVLTALLQDAGCRVVVARDGQEAIEATEQESFALALVDLHMPRLDGMGFARAYRTREPEGVRMPIIALTVTDAPEKRRQCLDCGMDDLLTKPVEVEVLAQLVRRAASPALA